MGILIFVLAAHDTQFTERRINKYGIQIESSWLVTNIYERFGLQLALAFGIMVPTLSIDAVLVAHNWTIALAMWLGAKILNTRYQYLSLVLEAEIDKYRNQSTVTSSSPSDASRPGDDQ